MWRLSEDGQGRRITTARGTSTRKQGKGNNWLGATLLIIRMQEERGITDVVGGFHGVQYCFKQSQTEQGEMRMMEYGQENVVNRMVLGVRE
jgi:hypothetical protein